MPIPKLNEHGWISPGTHEVEHISEIELVFANNPTRKKIWEGFIKFHEKIKSLNYFDNIFFGGSFISNKEDPGDIDIALDFKENIETPITNVDIFDIPKILQDYFVEVTFIEPSNDIIKEQLKEINFSTSKLVFFRTIKTNELNAFAQKLKCHPMDLLGKEFRGVIKYSL